MVTLSFMRLLLLTGRAPNADSDSDVSLTVTHPSGGDTWTLDLNDPTRDDREAGMLDDHRLPMPPRSDQEYRDWVDAGKPLDVGGNSSLTPPEVRNGPVFPADDVIRLGLNLAIAGDDAWQLGGYWLTGRFNWITTPPGSIDGVVNSKMVVLAMKNSSDVWLSSNRDEGSGSLGIPIDESARDSLVAAVTESQNL